MTDLSDIRRTLEASLGEEQMKKYLNLLRLWYSLTPNLTKVDFDTAIRKILITEEQYRCHLELMWGHLLPKTYIITPKAPSCTADKGKNINL